MRVSVVIPTYNCAQFVTEAVASVLAQSHPPAEVIVVDDGSTDDTEYRLRPYAGRINYIRKENGGVATARNRGMREAGGDYIAFLDADDSWHPRKLEIQADYLQAHPEIGLLGTGMINWPGEDFPSLPEGPTPATPVTFEQLVVKNLFVTSTIIVRREVVTKVGEFDTSLQGPEDYDFWLRCGRVCRTANLELPLTGYRDLQGSLSKQAFRMQSGMQIILDKLTALGAWKGRWLLRRKALGYFHFSCGWMHHEAGHRREALRNIVRSLMWYPLPYGHGEMRCFARLRLLRRALWNWLRGPGGSANSVVETTPAAVTATAPPADIGQQMDTRVLSTGHQDCLHASS